MKKLLLIALLLFSGNVYSDGLVIEDGNVTQHYYGPVSYTVQNSFYSEWITDIPYDEVAATGQFNITNTGTASATTGHGIALLSQASDSTNGKIPMFGGELRVNGLSTQAGIVYTGGMGKGYFKGSTFGGSMKALSANVEITGSDGVTPLNEGVGIGLEVPPIVGGSIKRSVNVYDPVQINSDLMVYDSTGTNYGTISKTVGGNLNISSDNAIVSLGSNHLTMDGYIKFGILEQATEPTIPADGWSIFWKDTDDSNRIYLVYRRGSGDQVKVELQ